MVEAWILMGIIYSIIITIISVSLPEVLHRHFKKNTEAHIKGGKVPKNPRNELENMARRYGFKVENKKKGTISVYVQVEGRMLSINEKELRFYCAVQQRYIFWHEVGHWLGLPCERCADLFANHMVKKSPEDYSHIKEFIEARLDKKHKWDCPNKKKVDVEIEQILIEDDEILDPMLKEWEES